MEFLQNIDLGALLLFSIGCVFLCVIGLLVLFGVQLLGTALGVVTNVFEMFAGILGGGPIAWCGCLVLLGICGGGIALVIVISGCNADPASMNFCALFP